MMAVIRLYGKRTIVCSGCGAIDPEWTWQEQPVCRRYWRWLFEGMRHRQKFGRHQLPKLRALLLERDGAACRYCGATEGELTLDHVIAKSRGGLLTPWNAVLCCRPCQDRKANHLPEHVGMRLRPLEIER